MFLSDIFIPYMINNSVLNESLFSKVLIKTSGFSLDLFNNHYFSMYILNFFSVIFLNSFNLFL